LTFTLTANEPITGLTASDISNVGTAQNCNISVTGTQPGRNARRVRSSVGTDIRQGQVSGS
jgi:hypothetical protein